MRQTHGALRGRESLCLITPRGSKLEILCLRGLHLAASGFGDFRLKTLNFFRNFHIGYVHTGSGLVKRVYGFVREITVSGGSRGYDDRSARSAHRAGRGCPSA